LSITSAPLAADLVLELVADAAPLAADLVLAPAQRCSFNKVSALSVLSNAVLVWNTVRMTDIVRALKTATGAPADPSDLARISPPYGRRSSSDPFKPWCAWVRWWLRGARVLPGPVVIDAALETGPEARTTGLSGAPLDGGWIPD